MKRMELGMPKKVRSAFELSRNVHWSRARMIAAGACRAGRIYGVSEAWCCFDNALCTKMLAI
jgi:hypothetical protein